MVRAYREDGKFFEAKSIVELFSLVEEDDRVYKVYLQDPTGTVVFLRMKHGQWIFTCSEEKSPHPNQGVLDV